MNNKEWEKLLKEHLPTKIEGNGYRFEVTFEDGTIVEIGTTTNYDSSCFTFESNWEKEANRKRWDAENKLKQDQKAEFEENKARIKAKFTTEQWEEIEQAFLFNNGMTFKQNMECQKQQQAFYKSMQDKYGVGGAFDQFIKEIKP